MHTYIYDYIVVYVVYACMLVNLYIHLFLAVLSVFKVIRERTRIQFENVRIRIRNYNYFPSCIGITNICFFVIIGQYLNIVFLR